MKRLLKKLRAIPTLNAAVTCGVRGGLRAAGMEWPWAVKHLHRLGGVEAPLPNGALLKLWSRGDDWVSNQLFWKGWDGYEGETSRVFFALARDARSTIDVGAHVGFFTLLAAHANPDGQVHAFEPLPINVERLRHNIALNALTNVVPHAAACGSRDGDGILFHGTNGLPTSNSLSSEFGDAHQGLSQTRVPVVRLQEALPGSVLECLDLMKIDTETTEPDVLQGLGETLHVARPRIVCEVLAQVSTGDALARLLQPLGYSFYLITPSGLERREKIVGHPEWLNYLFACDLPAAVAASVK